MRIAVLGAGVVGVAAAYELLKDGHEVVVVDRALEAASFASHANAGLIAPGHAYSWASPVAPGMMIRSLFSNDQAIRFKPRLSPAQWAWSWKFLKQCKAGRAEANTKAKARLCVYSQGELGRVAGETEIEFDRNTGGLIYFYRSAESFERAALKCEILRREGSSIEVLETPALVERDPGLEAAGERIAGGLLAATDESGDARLFTLALAERCREMGAEFRMGTEITGLDVSGGRVSGVLTDKGRIEAGGFVLCLGVFSRRLAGGLRLNLPIYPVKGYSVTLPVGPGHRPPRLGGVDEDNLLAYCPMGDRLRLTATAEISGFDTAHKPADFNHLLAKSREIFPAGADFDKPSYWAGLRPMTPTGLPIIDGSPIANLWLNTGHGHMGWTMACGSARLLADLVGGRETAIDRAPFHYAA